MNRNLIIVLFAVALFFGFKKYLQPSAKVVSMDSLRGPLSDYKVDQSPQIDQCFKRTQCILIYVAPWCPACHQFLKQYPMVKNQLLQKNIGTLIIVGADDVRPNEVAMKEELGSDAILDTVTGDFRKKHFVNSFPNFIVADPGGKVIATGSEGVDFLNRKMNEK